MIRLYFLICFCLLNWYFSNCYTMNSVLSRVRGCRTIRASHPNSGKLFNLQNFNSKAMNTALHEHETSSQEICSQIERSVLESMFEHNIGKSPTTCLLSVSGGSDSVAMMHILCAIKEGYKTKIDIEIVNFNHKARPESDEEAQFVGSWAEKYKVPYHSIELPEELRVKVGFQETARDWRRQECEKLIAAHATKSPVYICTGHNSDDQNETMMLKLLRGVHLSKFQPMKAINGPYFRPILGLSKQEIEQYLTLRGLEWREDSSNQSRDYKRNRVRLDLLPLMADLTGGKAALGARLAQIAQQSEDLQEWIDTECKQYNKTITYHSTTDPDSEYIARMSFPLPSTATTMPKLVLGELVRRWVHLVSDVELTAERMQALVEVARTKLLHKPTRAVTICKDFDVVRVKHELQLRRRVVPERHRHRT